MKQRLVFQHVIGANRLVDKEVTKRDRTGPCDQGEHPRTLVPSERRWLNDLECMCGYEGWMEALTALREFAFDQLDHGRWLIFGVVFDNLS